MSCNRFLTALCIASLMRDDQTPLQYSAMNDILKCKKLNSLNMVLEAKSHV